MIETQMRAKWTAIVLTCRSERDANAFQREIEIRQKKGIIAQDVILLTVEDPKSEVGSGGATLNALLVVAEYISAKQGFTVVNSDVLQSSLILIVHMGRRFPFDSTGVGAFVTLPLVRSQKNAVEGLVCNMDLLLETMTNKMALTTSSGVWVCSSDMFLNVDSLKDVNVVQTSDACVITVPASITYATMHGVCKLNAEGFVEDILYQCKSEETLKTCALATGLVPLVSGVVYFCARVAERLLSCHVLPPLDCCTYLGIDSGSSPICISLYFDVMLAMCQGMTEEKFVERRSVSSCTGVDVDAELILAARRLIWKKLCSFSVKTAMVEGRHSYMDLQPQCHLSHLLTPVYTSAQFNIAQFCHSHVNAMSSVAIDALLINSIVGDGVRIGPGTVIAHCFLERPLKVGNRSVISGLHDSDFLISGITLRDNITLQVFNVKCPNFVEQASQRVFVVTGITDNYQRADTFCGDSFTSFLSRTGVESSDLWHEAIPEHRRTLLNAQLYAPRPVGSDVGFIESLWLQGVQLDSVGNNDILLRWRSARRISLDEVLSTLDLEAEFSRRRELFFAVGKLMMNKTLLGGLDNGLNGLYQCAAVEGYAEKLCSVLDEIGANCNSAGSAARTLANIADALGAMSYGDGGLRSGPASNQQWQSAFTLLEKEDITGGFRAMAVERKNWLSQPAHLVRAARHYEGAAQILIRHAVMTARQFIQTKPCEVSPMSKWVTAECPARVDVAGGWSDTPPITYEHGGAVVNVAITVDGQKPVGAKARRIDSLHIVLHIQESGPLLITKLSDLKDYIQPHIPGALLKAALICAKIVKYPCETPLEKQLADQYGSGFELSTWSNLPHGSGLGTSSILAGAVMAVLWRASGQCFDINSLNHAVLHLEQMLTTGGGWQDQVGGLTPGIKVGHSKAELPVKIDVSFLTVPDDAVKSFSNQLILIYTGKTRLAKNLLQNVVRNWYARNPDIVETENQLVDNAWHCAKAFEKGDLAGVGQCMSTYWSQKKKMAPGCEPELVTKMMEALKPHALGMSLAGAGGGGFMYLLTKQPGMIDNVKQILQGIAGADDVQVCTASVDESGLVLTVEDEGQEFVPFQF